MKRKLTLNRETLADLTNDDLASIHGGIPTFEGILCYLVNPSEARCTATIIQKECIANIG